MRPQEAHTFGGDWTTDKIERVRKYLSAYTNIMKKQNFSFAYIDAFAGTGYRSPKRKEETGDFFPEFEENETQKFLAGSARVALEVEPPFEKYIFIEKDIRRCEELERMENEYPNRNGRIIVEKAEANAYLKDRCQNKDWKKHRAVLFLDPYGMEVEWETIKAIAETKAIDLWYLFPLGIAVNRILSKKGTINDTLRERLNRLFGAEDWYQAFYETETTEDLLGPVTQTEKKVNFDAIGNYFVSRLKTIFPGVAENPLPLRNSRNCPLYLLCFAAGNPKGSKTAIKFAQDILRRDR